jgi:hypothetical protein
MDIYHEAILEIVARSICSCSSASRGAEHMTCRRTAGQVLRSLSDPKVVMALYDRAEKRCIEAGIAKESQRPFSQIVVDEVLDALTPVRSAADLEPWEKYAGQRFGMPDPWAD